MVRGCHVYQSIWDAAVDGEVSEIYGPHDVLSLDASCCTWRTWVFVIPIEEEGISLLNRPSGSGRVPVSNLSSLSQ